MLRVIPNEDTIAQAGDIIRRGQLVAFPTETVYGLGADAKNPEAVARIYKVKGRPSDNPLIWHANRLESFESVVNFTADARKLAAAFWPGPFSMVLEGKEKGTQAVRVPSHPITRAIIEASGCIIAAPSANISGRPSPTCAQHVADDLEGAIEMLIDGGPTDEGLESTVVDLHTGEVRLLRPGAITLEMLRDVLGDTPCYAPDATDTPASEAPISPGMKYRHYAPEAPLILLVGPPDAVTDKLSSYTDGAGILRTYNKSPEYIAKNLFNQLRDFDRQNVPLILAEGVAEEGIGLAIMNRLRKAAAEVIYL